MVRVKKLDKVEVSIRGHPWGIKLERYDGDLTMSRSNAPISFKFEVKFRKGLKHACETSVKDFKGFVNETDIKIKYRELNVGLSNTEKEMFAYVFTKAALEYAQLPIWGDTRNRSLLEEGILRGDIDRERVREIIVENECGVGIGIYHNYAIRWDYKPLIKFYDKMVSRGLHYPRSSHFVERYGIKTKVMISH